MDNWQKHVFDKCSAFINEDFKYDKNEVTMSFNQREIYVLMKALEDQQKYLNPLFEIPPTVPVQAPESPVEA